MTSQIVLVPGFWLGAWAWDDVVAALPADHFTVVALTLPGLDPDASDAARAGVTLDDHVDAIVAALDRAVDRRVLVVHSGAAVPGTMVIDRHPELVDHIVFVDTAPVRDGFVMNAELTDDTLPIEAAWDEEFEQGSMRDLSDEQLATFRERAVPQPAGTVRGAVELHDDRRLDVLATVVATAFPAAEFRSYAEQGVPFLAGLLDHRNLRLIDLPTGHWPMWSRAVELATLLAEIANGG